PFRDVRRGAAVRKRDPALKDHAGGVVDARVAPAAEKLVTLDRLRRCRALRQMERADRAGLELQHAHAAALGGAVRGDGPDGPTYRGERRQRMAAVGQPVAAFPPLEYAAPVPGDLHWIDAQ